MRSINIHILMIFQASTEEPKQKVEHESEELKFSYINRQHTFSCDRILLKKLQQL